MNNLPYLLVAEKSILPIICKTVNSIYRHAEPGPVYLIAPETQLPLFHSTLGSSVQLLSEEAVLPDWPLSRVKVFLKQHPNRAGWYLQQFLKLGFGSYLKVPNYVIWDADTVMLSKPLLTDGVRVLFNTAKEYHQPYFTTFEKLLGYAPPLRSSTISQYMLIDSQICAQLQSDICRRSGCADWIEAVLKSLPGHSTSEFSEYETYSNYVAAQNPDGVLLQHIKWFRYGSEIIPTPEAVSINTIERRFRGYAYVAFERHGTSLTRWLGSRILLALGR